MQNYHVKKVPGLSGLSPWILKDFHSPRRMHGKYQEYWNRKGIISPLGEKKAAFNVLSEWYQELKPPGKAASRPKGKEDVTMKRRKFIASSVILGGVAAAPKGLVAATKAGAFDEKTLSMTIAERSELDLIN